MIKVWKPWKSINLGVFGSSAGRKIRNSQELCVVLEYAGYHLQSHLTAYQWLNGFKKNEIEFPILFESKIIQLVAVSVKDLTFCENRCVDFRELLKIADEFGLSACSIETAFNLRLNILRKNSPNYDGRLCVPVKAGFKGYDQGHEQMFFNIYGNFLEAVIASKKTWDNFYMLLAPHSKVVFQIVEPVALATAVTLSKSNVPQEKMVTLQI